MESANHIAETSGYSYGRSNAGDRDLTALRIGGQGWFLCLRCFESRASGYNYEESDHSHEKEEERLAGRKRRRRFFSADRCENQGAERLARRDACPGAKSHQA